MRDALTPFILRHSTDPNFGMLNYMVIGTDKAHCLPSHALYFGRLKRETNRAFLLRHVNTVELSGVLPQDRLSFLSRHSDKDVLYGLP